MFEIIEPSVLLKKYIKKYFIVEVSDTANFLPSERVLPNGCISMVFHYGQPSKFKPKNSEEYTEPGLVICGQQTTYYDLSLSGKTGMIVVLFKPHGVQPFFSLPITEIKNQNLALHELVKNEATELEGKIYHSKNNYERIAHIENFLYSRFVLNKDFERVEHAINIIEHTKGQAKTKYVADEVCLGIKQFERIFSKHVGLNPKKFASIVRLQNIIQLTKRFNGASLYQLAFDSGYYDQSHFIHEFKSFSGLAPGKFFKDQE